MPPIGYQESKIARSQDSSGGVKLIRTCVSDIQKRRERGGGGQKYEVLIQRRPRERDRELPLQPLGLNDHNPRTHFISFPFLSCFSTLFSPAFPASSDLHKPAFVRADSTSWQLKSSEGRGPLSPLSSGLSVFFSCLKRSAPCGGFVSVALSQRFETHHRPTTPSAVSSTPSWTSRAPPYHPLC